MSYWDRRLIIGEAIFGWVTLTIAVILFATVSTVLSTSGLSEEASLSMSSITTILFTISINAYHYYSRKKKHERKRLLKVKWDGRKTIAHVFARPAAFLVLFAFILLFSRYSDVLVISQHDSQIIGSFVEWFGILYGLLVALVTVTVWDKFRTVAVEIDKEADALYLLYRTARYLPDQNIRQEILARITEYARYVASAEVDQKRQRGQTPDNEADKLLDPLHEVCGKALASVGIDAILGRELLRRLNEVLDTRDDRIAHAQETIPATLWRLVIATSIIWLVSFFGLGIENDWIALFITGGAVFTISSLAEIIRDLDHPYSGEWKVSFESFESLTRLTDEA